MHAVESTEAPVHNELVGLLERIAAGDRGAFECLYSKTSSRMFAIGLWFLKRRSLAEEAMQDVYMSIWQHAGRYDAALAAPLTWMSTIMRNRARDLLRRPDLEQSIETAEGDRDAFEAIAAADEPPETLAELHADSIRLDAVLADLPAQSRQVLWLTYAHGLSNNELAAHLGVPLGTAKSWLRRAVQQLAARSLDTRGQWRERVVARVRPLGLSDAGGSERWRCVPARRSTGRAPDAMPQALAA